MFLPPSPADRLTSLCEGCGRAFRQALELDLRPAAFEGQHATSFVLPAPGNKQQVWATEQHQKAGEEGDYAAE